MSLPKTIGKCGLPRDQSNYTSFERSSWELSRIVIFIKFEQFCQTLWAFKWNFCFFITNTHQLWLGTNHYFSNGGYHFSKAWTQFFFKFELEQAIFFSNPCQADNLFFQFTEVKQFFFFYGLFSYLWNLSNLKPSFNNQYWKFQQSILPNMLEVLLILEFKICQNNETLLKGNDCVELSRSNLLIAPFHAENVLSSNEMPWFLTVYLNQEISLDN